MTAPAEQLPPEAMGLVADLMAVNAAQTASVTDWLLDNLTAQRDEAVATLAAIRDQMEQLLAQPWAPSASAIRECLYPGAETIDLYRESS